jgi:hypothetical protein
VDTPGPLPSETLNIYAERTCNFKKVVVRKVERKFEFTSLRQTVLALGVSRRNPLRIAEFPPKTPLKVPWRSTRVAAGGGSLDCRSPPFGRKVRFQQLAVNGLRTFAGCTRICCGPARSGVAGPSPGIRTTHFPFNAAQAASNSERLPSCSVSDTLSCLSERA